MTQPPAPHRYSSRLSVIGEDTRVARALPHRARRTVGAWCFLDHAGPVQFAPGKGMHVGAHPHIGLQTFTWMIEGEVMHRDSLGHEQVVRPGQVNLMTAGRGIAHTEESLTDETRLHAAQLWIALPAHAADIAPRFDTIPICRAGSRTVSTWCCWLANGRAGARRRWCTRRWWGPICFQPLARKSRCHSIRHLNTA